MDEAGSVYQAFISLYLRTIVLLGPRLDDLPRESNDLIDKHLIDLLLLNDLIPPSFGRSISLSECYFEIGFALLESPSLERQ